MYPKTLQPKYNLPKAMLTGIGFKDNHSSSCIRSEKSEIEI